VSSRHRVIAALLPFVLGACGSLPWPGALEVGLGSGMIGGAGWSAAVYESRQEGACIRVQFEGASPQDVCRGAGGRPFGANILSDPRGTGYVVIVELLNSTMTKGSLTFDLRPGIPVAIVDAAGLGRYAVAAVEGEARPLQLVLDDAPGRVQETIGMPRR
jgi:hypothetical protein